MPRICHLSHAPHPDGAGPELGIIGSIAIQLGTSCEVLNWCLVMRYKFVMGLLALLSVLVPLLLPRRNLGECQAADLDHNTSLSGPYNGSKGA